MNFLHSPPTKIKRFWMLFLLLILLVWKKLY